MTTGGPGPARRGSRRLGAGHRHAPGILCEWIQVPVGDDDEPMPAFVARPEGAGFHPAVVVGFEMFGITEYVRGVAQRLARHGCLALVPDFYHRQSPGTELSADDAGREEGLRLLHGLTREGVRRDVQAALAYLRQQPDSGDRAAMLGLSVGGHIAYYAATQVPLAALVVYYPGWLTGTDIALSQPEPTLTLTPKIAQLGTPMLFLVGDSDQLFTESQHRQIAHQLRQDGVRHELVIYPGTPHGFFCDERDTYRPGPAADAWDRTTALLDRELAPR